MSDIESEIRLFADDCVCYREIQDIEDTLKLQKDIDRLGIWARKWGMRFQPVKCNMMQFRWSISIGVPLYLHTDGDRSHRRIQVSKLKLIQI